jgi:hypothetical protein
MARFPYTEWTDKNFAKAGKPTINVFKLLSYSPATVELWTSIGYAHFTQLSLSKKNRELVVLLSAAKFKSSYEWIHHIPLSARLGVTDAHREELERAGKTKNYFSKEYWRKNKAKFEQKEIMLLTFLEAVLDTGEVDEQTWQNTIKTFSEREIAEILSLQVS